MSVLAAAVGKPGDPVKLQGCLLPAASPPVVDPAPTPPAPLQRGGGGEPARVQESSRVTGCHVPRVSRSPPGWGPEPGRGTLLGLRCVVVQLPGVGGSAEASL